MRTETLDRSNNCISSFSYSRPVENDASRMGTPGGNKDQCHRRERECPAQSHRRVAHVSKNTRAHVTSVIVLNSIALRHVTSLNIMHLSHTPFWTRIAVSASGSKQTPSSWLSSLGIPLLDRASSSSSTKSSRAWIGRLRHCTFVSQATGRSDVASVPRLKDPLSWSTSSR